MDIPKFYLAEPDDKQAICGLCGDPIDCCDEICANCYDKYVCYSEQPSPDSLCRAAELGYAIENTATLMAKALGAR